MANTITPNSYDLVYERSIQQQQMMQERLQSELEEKQRVADMLRMQSGRIKKAPSQSRSGGRTIQSSKVKKAFAGVSEQDITMAEMKLESSAKSKEQELESEAQKEYESALALKPKYEPEKGETYESHVEDVNQWVKNYEIPLTRGEDRYNKTQGLLKMEGADVEVIRKRTTYGNQDVQYLAKQTDKYDVEYYANGAVKSIKEKPTEFIAQSLYINNDGNITDEESKASYIPYEIELNEDGTIKREVKRDTYRKVLDRQNEKDYSYQKKIYSPFDDVIVEYDEQGRQNILRDYVAKDIERQSGHGYTYIEKGIQLDYEKDLLQGYMIDMSNTATAWQPVTYITNEEATSLGITGSSTGTGVNGLWVSTSAKKEAELKKELKTKLDKKEFNVVASDLFGTSDNILKEGEVEIVKRKDSDTGVFTSYNVGVGKGVKRIDMTFGQLSDEQKIKTMQIKSVKSGWIEAKPESRIKSELRIKDATGYGTIELGYMAQDLSLAGYTPDVIASSIYGAKGFYSPETYLETAKKIVPTKSKASKALSDSILLEKENIPIYIENMGKPIGKISKEFSLLGSFMKNEDTIGKKIPTELLSLQEKYAKASEIIATITARQINKKYEKEYKALYDKYGGVPPQSEIDKLDEKRKANIEKEYNAEIKNKGFDESFEKDWEKIYNVGLEKRKKDIEDVQEKLKTLQDVATDIFDGASSVKLADEFLSAEGQLLEGTEEYKGLKDYVKEYESWKTFGGTLSKSEKKSFNKFGTVWRELPANIRVTKALTNKDPWYIKVLSVPGEMFLRTSATDASRQVSWLMKKGAENASEATSLFTDVLPSKYKESYSGIKSEIDTRMTNAFAGGYEYFRYKKGRAELAYSKGLLVAPVLAIGGTAISPLVSGASLISKTALIAGGTTLTGFMSYPIIKEGKSIKDVNERWKFYGEQFLGEGGAFVIGGAVGGGLLYSGVKTGIYRPNMVITSKLRKNAPKSRQGKIYDTFGSQYYRKISAEEALKIPKNKLRTRVRGKETYYYKPIDYREAYGLLGDELLVEQLSGVKKQLKYGQQFGSYTPAEMEILVKLPSQDIPYKALGTTKISMKGKFELQRISGKESEIRTVSQINPTKNEYYLGEKIKSGSKVVDVSRKRIPIYDWYGKKITNLDVEGMYEPQKNILEFELQRTGERYSLQWTKDYKMVKVAQPNKPFKIIDISYPKEIGGAKITTTMVTKEVPMTAKEMSGLVKDVKPMSKELVIEARKKGIVRRGSFDTESGKISINTNLLDEIRYRTKYRELKKIQGDKASTILHEATHKLDMGGKPQGKIIKEGETVSMSDWLGMVNEKKSYLQQKVSSTQAEKDYYNILSKIVSEDKAKKVIGNIKKNYKPNDWTSEFSAKIISAKPNELIKPTTKTSLSIKDMFDEAFASGNKGLLPRTPKTVMEKIPLLEVKTKSADVIKPKVTKSEIKVAPRDMTIEYPQPYSNIITKEVNTKMTEYPYSAFKDMEYEAFYSGYNAPRLKVTDVMENIKTLEMKGKGYKAKVNVNIQQEQINRIRFAQLKTEQVKVGNIKPFGYEIVVKEGSLLMGENPRLRPVLIKDVYATPLLAKETSPSIYQVYSSENIAIPLKGKAKSIGIPSYEVTSETFGKSIGADMPLYSIRETRGLAPEKTPITKVSGKGYYEIDIGGRPLEVRRISKPSFVNTLKALEQSKKARYVKPTLEQQQSLQLINENDLLNNLRKVKIKEQKWLQNTRFEGVNLEVLKDIPLFVKKPIGLVKPMSTNLGIFIGLGLNSALLPKKTNTLNNTFILKTNVSKETRYNIGYNSILEPELDSLTNIREVYAPTETQRNKVTPILAQDVRQTQLQRTQLRTLTTLGSMGEFGDVGNIVPPSPIPTFVPEPPPPIIVGGGFGRLFGDLERMPRSQRSKIYTERKFSILNLQKEFKEPQQKSKKLTFI